MTMEELKKFLEDKNASIKIQGGLTPASLLGIVFIVLKLTGVITWSWWWVLAPFWLPILLFIAICIIVFGIAIAIAFYKAKKEVEKIEKPVEVKETLKTEDTPKKNKKSTKKKSTGNGGDTTAKNN